MSGCGHDPGVGIEQQEEADHEEADERRGEQHECVLGRGLATIAAPFDAVAEKEDEVEHVVFSFL